MTDTGRDSRIRRLAVLASQTLNVLIFDGEPDETVSGRAWREGAVGGNPVWERRRQIIDRAFALVGDHNHCRNSHEKDIAFARLILAK